MKKRYNCPHIVFSVMDKADVLSVSGVGNRMELSPDYFGGSWE